MPDTTPLPLPECPREDCTAILNHCHKAKDGDAYNCLRQLGGSCPTHDRGGTFATRCYAPRTQPAPDEDERIAAWAAIAGHPFFAPCYATAAPLLGQMLDRLDGLAAQPAPQPPAVVLPTVDEAVEAVIQSMRAGGWTYRTAAQAVLDLIAGRVTPWKPVAPGTIIKAGTRYRCEIVDGESTEGTYSLDLTTREDGWFIDPRTVPAEPEDPRAELLAEELHDHGGCEERWPCCSVSTVEHYRNDARDLLARLDAMGADQ